MHKGSFRVSALYFVTSYGLGVVSLTPVTRGVACNIGAVEFEKRTSTPKRPLFLRKVKLKNPQGKLKISGSMHKQRRSSLV